MNHGHSRFDMAHGSYAECNMLVEAPHICLNTCNAQCPQCLKVKKSYRRAILKGQWSRHDIWGCKRLCVENLISWGLSPVFLALWFSLRPSGMFSFALCAGPDRKRNRPDTQGLMGVSTRRRRPLSRKIFAKFRTDVGSRRTAISRRHPVDRVAEVLAQLADVADLFSSIAVVLRSFQLNTPPLAAGSKISASVVLIRHGSHDPSEPDFLCSLLQTAMSWP